MAIESVSSTALVPEQREAIKEWVYEAISYPHAKKMAASLTDPADKEAAFPFDGEHVPYHVGMSVYKYSICTNINGGALHMNEDLRALSLSRSGEKNFKRLKERLAKSEDRGMRDTRRCAALIEAQSGFYTLTSEEYDALRRLLPGEQRPHFSGAHEAESIFKNKPRALETVSFEEFNVIVGEVLKELKLPSRAELEAKSQDATAVITPLVSVPVEACVPAAAAPANEWQKRITPPPIQRSAESVELERLKKQILAFQQRLNGESGKAGAAAQAKVLEGLKEWQAALDAVPQQRRGRGGI